MGVGSSTFNVNSATNSASTGLSGLMSGMDTQGMVDKLLSGTQIKIDDANGDKQQLEWKQEIYQDVISIIQEFQNKFFSSQFDSGLKTNLASNDFFNSMLSAISGGSAAKIISTDSDASIGDMDLKVKQLAASSKIESEKKMSTGKITGLVKPEKGTKAYLAKDTLKEKFDKQIVLSLGEGSTKATVKVDLNSVKTEQEMVDAINSAIQGSGSDKFKQNISAKMFDGKLRLINNSTETFGLAAGTTQMGKAMTGLDQVSTSDITDANGAKIGMVVQAGDPEIGSVYTFDLTLNNVTTTISLDGLEPNSEGEFTAKALQEAIKKEVELAFGDDVIRVELVGDTEGEQHLELSLSKSATESGHELRITGSDATTILGIRAGSSTNINTNSLLGDLGASGNGYEFNINGTEFSFKSTDSLGKLITTINNSDAGVRLTYSTMSDTFKMESSSTGAARSIKVSEQSGNLLGTLFQAVDVAASGDTPATYNSMFNNAGSALSEQLTVGTIKGDSALSSTFTAEKQVTFKMTVNGVMKEFGVSPSTDIVTGKPRPLSDDDIINGFNKEFKNWYGETDGEANIKLNKNGTISVKEGYVVEFEATKVDTENAVEYEEAIKTDIALAMGFTKTAKSNIANKDTKIADVLQFKGTKNKIHFKGDGNATLDFDNDTIGDIRHTATVKNINATNNNDKYYTPWNKIEYSSDGRLSLMKNNEDTVQFDKENNAALAEIFGDGEFSFGNGEIADPANLQLGLDAIVIINDVETSRASNTFSFDGVTMELTDVSEGVKTNEDGTFDATTNMSEVKDTTITTSRNTDEIVEGMKSFVDEYNKMIEALHKYTGAEETHDDYPPLTTAQRQDMSESEIKLWEEKAKQGLIAGDSTVNSFLGEIRTLLYTKPEGSKFGLYNIGIETGDDWKKDGKLFLDESALRNALASDPDSVRILFTDAEEGISAKMMTALDGAVNDSAGSPGSLIQLAGMEGSSAFESNNEIYRTLESIKERIENLKNKYDLEKLRYWKQFNNMESVMANYNSQSTFLSQQFGN